ncbi:MAG: hypothetical protein RBT22_08380 [Aliarcobacter sp.]|jgi:hypothetical protein|nr:hypothetical protein [Aliarcobacter sp.]
MKKLLLITSFLASQLFAVQCTEEQYKPFFDKNSDRYKHCCSAPSLGNTVIDIKSIEYKKDLQTIKLWSIQQYLSADKIGMMKILYEFDIKNNKWRYSAGHEYNCEGVVIQSYSDLNWKPITPETTTEFLLKTSKSYLNKK